MSHQILIGDCREQMRTLPAGSVHCVVTSPPYFGLRDYGVDGQIGLEPTPAEFVATMVAVFSEVWRVLRDDGVCFVNLGDSYNGTGRGGGSASVPGTFSFRDKSQGGMRIDGLKPKDLCGMPWRVAFALQEAGWYLRQDIIWAKPNPMPESVRDRCCKAHEYIFLLTKSPRYFWDGLAIATPTSAKTLTVNTTPRKGNGTESTGEKLNGWMEVNGGRQHPATSNRRSVWQISTQSFKGAHFATFPERIPELCIKAGTSERGCCQTCGKQWMRVVEKVRRPSRPGENTKCGLTGGAYAPPGQTPHSNARVMEVGNRDPQRHVTETVTTGWRPDCKCGPHEPVPSIVLDPFLGSGTTVQVATHLGRHGIGCELSPVYAALAEERIATPPRFLTKKSVKKRPRKAPSQQSLFP